mmetsp:Transcript_6049/g.21500  ORF Transcript_6049/g.21500 Transcript_6049/m.21500 type:complete len:411 (-) Transcript_6049:33-1265(-)
MTRGGACSRRSAPAVRSSRSMAAALRGAVLCVLFASARGDDGLVDVDVGEYNMQIKTSWDCRAKYEHALDHVRSAPDGAPIVNPACLTRECEALTVMYEAFGDECAAFCTAAAAAGDGGAWADFIGTQVFSAKVGFIMHNALNIHLLASAFQLALAIAAWPSDGGPSAVSGGAFSALVRDQDLFGACITALSEAETLVQDGVSPDALPRLDVVLRVAALATDRHRPTRPVETALAKALLGTLASERSRSEHSCAVVALSKLNPSEFLSPAYFEDASRRTAVVAALAAVLDDALDDVLDDDDVLDPTDEFSAAAAAGHALRLAANVFSAAEAAARAAADGAPRVPSDPALHLATTRLLGIVLRLVENATEPAAAKMRLGHLRDRYADVVRYAEDATAPAPLAGSKRARDGG